MFSTFNLAQEASTAALSKASPVDPNDSCRSAFPAASVTRRSRAWATLAAERWPPDIDALGRGDTRALAYCTPALTRRPISLDRGCSPSSNRRGSMGVPRPPTLISLDRDARKSQGCLLYTSDAADE